MTFTPRGSGLRAYNSTTTWLEVGEPTIDALVQLPGTPFVTSTHDAFGRAFEVTERDGSVSRMEYGALETWAYDAIDTGQHGMADTMEHATFYIETPSISRTDGHGRAIDQVLHHRNGSMANRFYRLFTTHRCDGAVLSVRRAETATGDAADTTAISTGGTPHELTRTFSYDSAGRRIGTTDPDSDGSGPATASGWRYQYSAIGDLLGVRDSRGCGANYYYDMAGRLVGEDYVECDETAHQNLPSGTSTDQGPADESMESLPGWAFGEYLSTPSSAVHPDVLYHFDEAPYFASTWGTPSAPHLIGRLSGTEDRAHRAAVAYDVRGRPTWSGRQMALMPSMPPAADTLLMGAPQQADGDGIAGAAAVPREYDEAHTYVATTTYDRVDRVIEGTMPEDPDWALFGGTGPAPVVGGRLGYDERGFMRTARLDIDDGTSTYTNIAMRCGFNAQGLHTSTAYGSSGTSSGLPVADGYSSFDDRLRPYYVRAFRRNHVRHGSAPELSDVRQLFIDNLTWDAANNLIQIRDGANHAAYPDTQKPRRQTVEHDALYRVTGVDYDYRTSAGWTPSGANTATDPRQEQAFHHLGDPMRRVPAPMLASMPSERPNNITYDYDWLGNQTVWNDDAHAFYERSLGTSDSSRRDLLNGTDANESSTGHRPAALYFASNVDHLGGGNNPAIDRGGYLEVEYGESGNVLSMTVRAQCHDTTTTTCDDPGGTSESARASSLQTNCVCDAEQHYQYRWDALNRLSFARRYDRGTAHPDWRLEVRQQYRYDGANVRMVKRSRDGFSHGASMNGQDGMERVALYVMPGDFERRGLQTGALSYDASVTLGTETQYLIAGTRLVWKDASALSGGAVTSFDRDARLTASVPDLLQSSVATLDLMTGELLERGTYLPSGVRETLRTVRDEGTFQLEPVGFTGKEGDDEVGLVYFGHRYLMPHLGRWASPDPLQVHAGGGGEFGNSFHYVGGNLLQARDPDGLDGEDVEAAALAAFNRAFAIGILTQHIGSSRHIDAEALADAARDYLHGIFVAGILYGRFRSAAHLLHYMDGSGDAIVFSTSDTHSLFASANTYRQAAGYLRDVLRAVQRNADGAPTREGSAVDTIVSDIARRRESGVPLADGETMSFDSLVTHPEKFSHGGQDDWHTAVGGFDYRVHGTLTYRAGSEQQQEGFDVSYQISFTDEYDYHDVAGVWDSVAKIASEGCSNSDACAAAFPMSGEVDVEGFVTAASLEQAEGR